VAFLEERRGGGEQVARSIMMRGGGGGGGGGGRVLWRLCMGRGPPLALAAGRLGGLGGGISGNLFGMTGVLRRLVPDFPARSTDALFSGISLQKHHLSDRCPTRQLTGAARFAALQPASSRP